MDFHIVFIILFLTAAKDMCFGAENTTVCSEQERLALVKFKQSVKDDFGMLSSWVGNECCEWKGVHCDVATISIVGLDLRGHNIWNSYYFPESYPTDEPPSDTEDYSPVGEDYYLIGDHLNSSLAELRNLKYLDLSGNDFQKDQIPQFIGSLKHLSYLNLSNAGFSGMIPPHIGNLSKLEILDLSAPNQDLRVDDMEWIFDLSLLKHLNLSGVDLTRAQNVNMVLYMIPSLIELCLSHCSLTNAHLGAHLNLSTTLPNIQYLDLSKNFFKDQLPPFLQNMTSLEFLDLSYYDFSLPWNFANFLNLIPSLSELHMSSCGLHSDHLSPTNLNFSTHSNIQQLDLSWNLIEGSFPSFLANMSSLRVLDLHHNFLNSSVPVMLNLVRLDISDNNFTSIKHVGLWRQCHLKELLVSRNYLREEIVGPSTNISRCSQHGLEVLHLDHNQLNGSIPESLIRMTNLRVLDLSSNRLTNSIPKSLERLRMLLVLDLSSNELVGRLPVWQLSKISFLNMSNNYLEGMLFESHFANLTMLNYLDISSNRNLTFNVSHEWIPPFQLRVAQLGSCKIAGEFPQWVRTQSKLKKLVLFNTSISGPLPTWLKQMPIIPHLDLSHNNLTGPLTNLPFNRFRDEYRGSLLLQNNFFNGSIPKSLCTRTALQVFDLSRNRLTGEMPTCLGHLQNLRAMLLSYNGLSGVIPSSIGHNSLLSWLHLDGNNFTGELPQNLQNLNRLWILDLGNNELSGMIPEWISELAELMVLRLHKNKFSGRIPPSLCKIPCLQILDVAHNILRGPIPRCIKELSGMVERDYCRHYIYSKENMIQVFKGSEYLFFSRIILPFVVNMDLSSNRLVGQIPKELTALSLLVGLNLSRNYLSGSIPDNMGDMKNLESLDLSENMLTGMIPQSMTDLGSLVVLHLSHNTLSGPIPQGHQFSAFDSSSFADNEELCGIPLPKICINNDLATTTTKNKHNATDDPNKLWFYLDIVCGFATGFLGLIGVLLFNKKWRRKFYRSADATMDNIYVLVAIRVAKMKRSRDAA